MSRETLTPQVPSTHLTDAERDRIPRQGMTARALEGERRRVRDRLSAMNDQVARVREQLRRPPGRFDR